MEIAQKIESVVNQYNLLFDTEIDGYKSVLSSIQKSFLSLPKDRLERKTFLDIIRRAHDENMISDYLAYILNPNENGIGTLPLKNLLSHYLADIDLYSFNKVEITRESSFSDLSRIDLIIESKEDGLVIAIENKVGTREHSNQTKTYESNLLSNYPDSTILMLFLAPYDKENISSTEFKWLTYKELYKHLSIIPLDNFYEVDSLKFFQDFLLHINLKFIKKMELKLSEKAKLYLDNKDVIDDILAAYNHDTEKYVNFINEITQEYFSSDSSEWQFSFSPDRGYQYFMKKSWSTANIFIHYEWWFSRTKLINDLEFQFMLEVESKNNQLFLKEFENRNKPVIAKIKALGFDFRPTKRKNAICHTTFKLPKNIITMSAKEIEQAFTGIYDKVSFLIEEIDKMVGEFA